MNERPWPRSHEPARFASGNPFPLQAVQGDWVKMSSSFVRALPSRTPSPQFLQGASPDSLQSAQFALMIANPLQVSQVSTGTPMGEVPVRPLPLQVAQSFSVSFRPLHVAQIVQSLQPLNPSRHGLPAQIGQFMEPVWLQRGQPAFLKMPIP